MARKDKYYGTNALIWGGLKTKLIELGYKGHHSQFRVVCKAKSRAEANRIAEGYGLGRNVFQAGYTSETGNRTELDMCDKHGFIININGTFGDNYVGISELIGE